MKKLTALSLLTLFGMFLGAPSASAAARTASVSGNWSDTATWGGDPAPVAGDTVTINVGVTVTVDSATAACTSVALANAAAGTATLTFDTSGTAKLTVSAAVTVGNAANAADRGVITFTSGSTLVCASLALGPIAAQTSTIDMTAGGTLQVGGAITTSSAAAVWTPGTGTVIFTANNTLPATIFTSFDNLAINGGTTTMGVGLTIGSLSIGNGATFTAGNFALTVTGTTTVGGGATGTLTISGATGTKTFTGAVTINTGGALNETAAATLSFGGDVTINGTLTEFGAAVVGFAGNLTNNATYNDSTGVHTFSGAAKTIGGANPIPIASVAISGTYTNAGTLTVSTALTGGGTLTQAANSTLNIGGTSTIATLDATASPNTVNYNGAAQTVKAITYDSLTLSGSNTKTMPAATTTINSDFSMSGSASATSASGQTTSVGGDLSLSDTARLTTAGTFSVGGNLAVGNGTTLTVGPNQITVTGTTTVGGGGTGTLTLNAAAGPVTFTGDVTINSGGAWTGAGAPVSFSGSLLNNGTFTGGAGVQTFTGAGKTFSGSGTITIPNLTVDGTYQNNGTLTVSTALAGAGTLTQGTGATLNIGGTSTITTLVATASPNLVNYNGAAQTVFPTDYYNLTLSGSGAKTMTGVTTIAGDLTISNTATMTGNAGFTVSGTLNYNSTAGTTTLTDSTPITIGKFSQNGTGGTFNDGGNTITVTGTGAGIWTRVNGTFTATGTALFTGAEPRIGAANFNNLNLGGSAVATNTAAVTAVNLNIADGTSFASGIFDLTVSGTTTVGGGTSGSLTIASTTGTKSFGNVTVNNGATWNNSANENVTISGNLANSGTFMAGSGIYTLSGASKTISGTISFPGDVNVAGTYQNNGTLTVASFDASDGSGTLTQGANSTLNYSGAGGTFDAALVATASPNLVNYNRTGAQDVKATTYDQLTVSGGNTKTLVGAIVVNSDLTIATGTTLDVSGTDYSISVGGNWVNNGTSFNPQSGTVTFTGASKSIGGTASATFNALAIAAGASTTLTKDTTCASLTFGAGATSSSLTHSGTTLLTVNGTVTINQPTADATTAAWNINAGTATVSGLITLAGVDTTVTRIGTIVITTGTLNANGGMTFVASAAATKVIDMTGGAGNLNLKGVLTVPAASSTLTAGTTSVFNFVDTANRTVNFFSAGAYNILHFNNTGAAGATLGAAITAANVTGDVAVETGTLANGGFAIDLALDKNFSVAAGATFNLTGTSTMVTVSGTGTKIFDPASTVNYGGAAQTVSLEPYGNLTLSGSGTKTMPGSTMTIPGNFTMSGTASATAGAAINVTGNVTLGTGTTFNGGTFTHTVGGDWVNNGGTHTPASSTIVFNDTGAGQAIRGSAPSQTFNNIIVDKSGQTLSVTASTTTLIVNDLTETAGNFTAPATLTINGSLTLTAGTFTAGTTINIKGDWSRAAEATFTPGSGTVNFNNTSAAQTIGGSATSQTFNAITVAKTAQTLDVGGSTTTLTLNGTITLTSGTFAAGTATAINLTAGNWTNNGGTFDPGTGTVTFNGSLGQAINGTANNQSFYNLVVNKSGNTLVATAPNTLTVQDFTETAGNFTAPGTFTINGNFLHSAGTLTAGNTINVKGNWTRDGGTFTPGANTVAFNGTGVQSIAGAATTGFGNLTIANAAGVSLAIGATVNGVLTLTSGEITAGVNQLILGTAATVSGGSTGSHVNGTLLKNFLTSATAFTFPIGDGSVYAPVALTTMTVGTAGTLTATTTGGVEPPNIGTSGINSAQDVNRYWTVTPGGGFAASGVTAQFTFAAGDVDAGASPTTAFVVARYSSGAWSGTTVNNRTATSTRVTGLSAFGEFAIGENAIDHYAVTFSGPPNNAGVAFTTTVTAQDVIGQTVLGDSTTVVANTGTGSVQFDANADNVYGDNTKALSSGVATFQTKDNVAETVTVTATDANLKTGSAAVSISSATGDFRSIASGNWDDITKWERYDGTTWQPNFFPTNASAGVVTIQSGHTMTITANVTSDQVIVEAGGQVTVNATFTWTIAAGAGTDLDVYGTVNNAGTMTMTGAGVFQSGSKYQHARDGGTIAAATRAANSTCEVTGMVGTGVTGLNQTFGNFKWNCTGQTANQSLPNTGTMTIAGNLEINSTGSGQLQLNQSPLTVTGDLIQTGGSLRITGGTTARAITVGGNFSQSTGTLTMSDGTSGIGTLNVAGDFSHTGGTITETASTAGVRGAIVFNGTGTQTYTSGGTVANTISFTVNSGATLMTGTSLVGNGSDGTFTLATGATLGIGDAAGITTSGASGNIRVSGTRTFNAAANYTYNGTAAQVTGNGLPATLTGNLTIANGNGTGVTLSQSTAINTPGVCTVNNGALLTMGSAIVLSGTGTFTLASGGTLAIGSTVGITSSGATGNIQTTTRSYSSGANYVYNGTAGQAAGNGLPATVNSLTDDNTGDTVTLAQQTTVTTSVTLASGAKLSLPASTTSTAATLSLGGVNKSSGTWGSSSSSPAATHQDDNYFAGTGLLSITTGVASATALSTSLNPSLPSQSITFTATVTGPGGTPTGTVEFKSNGSSLGSPIALDGGGQAQIIVLGSAVGHGSRTITAEYSGDVNFNSGTGTLSPNQVVNTPPEAGAHNLATVINTSLGVSATALGGLDYDADDDALVVTNVIGTASTQGGSISFSSGQVNYTPPSSTFVGSDSFTYTVSDAYGGTAISTANVTVRLAKGTSVITSISPPDGNGYVQLRGYGIPGNHYDIQYSSVPDFSSDVNILESDKIAAANGVILGTDTSPSPPRYYRFAVH